MKLYLLAALFVVVLASVPATVRGYSLDPVEDFDSLPYDITYLGTRYHCPTAPGQVGYTSFDYRIVTDESTDLSSWLVGRVDEGCPDNWAYSFSAHNDRMWRDYAEDVHSLMFGYKERFGQEQGTTQEYHLMFDGMVGTGDVRVVLRGPDNWGNTTLPGPDCTAIRNYDECGSAPEPEPVSTCNDTELLETPSNAVDGEHKSMGCEHTYRFERTLSYYSGDLESVFVQTIYIEDLYDPVLTGTFSNHLLECGTALPDPPQDINATDMCDSWEDVSISSPCEHPRVRQYAQWPLCVSNIDYTRTWTAVDTCGNSACATQEIRVRDREPPRLIGTDEDDVFRCTAETDAVRDNPPTVTAEDDCSCVIGEDNEDHGVGFEQEEWGLCGRGYKLKRTWNATDCCGNFVTKSVRLVFEDQDDPVIHFEGGDLGNQSGYCGTPPYPMNATASDDCVENTIVVDRTDDGGVAPLCPQNRTTTYTYTACDECGKITTEERTVEIYDGIPPDILDVPPNIPDAECGFVTAAANLIAEDACDETVTTAIVSDSQHDPTSCSYQIIRTWTVEDACRNPKTETQIIDVTDTQPPTFTSYPPANDEVLCTEGIPTVEEYGVAAWDDCTGEATVTRTEVDRAEGLCNNYRVLFEYIATDGCNHTTPHYQNVSVVDNSPPWTRPNPPLCFRPVLHAPFHKISDVTVPGEFFDTGDECNAVTITIESCTSLQDDHWDLGYGPFTDDCYYNASDDSLYVRARFNWAEPDGRVFTVLGKSENECGLSKQVSRKIWIPVDEYSDANLTISFEEDCVHVPPDCPALCPCEYNYPECATVTPAEREWSVDALDPIVTEDATEFRYVLKHEPDHAPDHFSLGIDLRGITVIEITPDLNVHIGRVPGSYLHGITFSIPGGNAENYYSIKLAGNWSNEQSIPFQLLADNEPAQEGEASDLHDDMVTHCTSPSTTLPGPKHVADAPANGGITVGGHVHVVGALFGNSTAARIPLSNVVVQVVAVGNAKTLGCFTLTDDSGYFLFHNILDAENFNLRIDRSTLAMADFLSGGIVDEAFEPKPIVEGDDNDFVLYLVHNALPEYFNPLADGEFKGRSRSAEWWTYQVAALPVIMGGSNAYGVPTIKAPLMNNYVDAHDEYAPDCDTALTALKDGTTIEKNLVAAILNHVSGRGFFEPFDAVEDLWLQWAMFTICKEPNPNEDDVTTAAKLINRILAAN